MNDYSADYAKYYELLTGHKNYEYEIHLLLRHLAFCGFGQSSRVLSVGCGIGSHERLLAKHVSTVTGIDQSPYMIKYGRELTNPSNLFLENKDLTHIENAMYDVVISLFNVINCVPSGPPLARFIKSITDKLNPRGTIILECWNQKATIAVPPQKVVRDYSSDCVSLSRTALPHLDSSKSTLRLEYIIKGFDRDKAISIKSTHELYLHSIEVIEKQLIANNFTSIKWYSALSEGMNALADDRVQRMLLVSATRA